MTSSIMLKSKFLQIATNHVMVSLPPVGHIAGSFPVAASLSRKLEIEDDVDTKKFLNHSFASCLFDYHHISHICLSMSTWYNYLL